MLDQMFTAENFRRIYDNENRKGSDLATRFFPEIAPFTLNVRNKVQEIRKLRKTEPTITADDFKAQLLVLTDELVKLKADKSSAIDILLDGISKKVLKSSFKIDLSQKTGPKGKPVFCIDTKPETFFVIKQLQHNIQRIYGVKQANRHNLVCQLRDMLGSKFPFEVVRTDISSFYESIDRKELIKKLDNDQLLSPASKKYIKQVLDSYGRIASTPCGIPRGVGISAYLAELYLRPVDKAIRALPGLVLYCRFVDDIVAVFARPPTGIAIGSLKNLIIGVFGDSNLTHNEVKTLEFKLPSSDPVEFEYLGYRFCIKSGKFEISPSAPKVLKYRARIDAVFAAYWQEKSTNPRSAFRKLVGRIKFLTGNTRLSNSKSSAATGIYFNNSIATDLSCLTLLDTQLMAHIDQLERSSLQEKLKKLKFTEGFEQRRYHSFSPRELQMIVRVWKHG